MLCLSCGRVNRQKDSLLRSVCNRDPRKPTARLVHAICVGMVEVAPETKQATILAPPDVEKLSDEEWLNLLRAASAVREELEGFSYTVRG